MLRMLGLKNRNLVVLLTIQSFLFAIPGLLLGFVINFICSNGATLALYYFVEYGALISMKKRTVLLGLALGLVLPLFSNIIPMKHALGKSLRNALNQIRSAFDEFEVNVVRMKNFGISPNQLIIALTLLFCGFITYYHVPQAFIYRKMNMFTFYINLLLLFLIVGMIMVAQMLIPVMERWLLNLFLFFRPGDAKMKPVVRKNLESHGKRNLKTSLMFTVTLSFLVFSGANFR